MVCGKITLTLMYITVKKPVHPYCALKVHEYDVNPSQSNGKATHVGLFTIGAIRMIQIRWNRIDNNFQID